MSRFLGYILNGADLWILLFRRYVALKIIVARLANASNEIGILQYLHDTPQLRKHPGREHILGLLDHFRVSGPSETHNVLVLDIVGLSPEELRSTMMQVKSSYGSGQGLSQKKSHWG
jgi:hypothetical protein